MGNYKVRIGERETFAKDYTDLVDSDYRYAEDDGLSMVLGQKAWPQDVQCLDCRSSNIAWAEGCYVPGHRICPNCGSHWELRQPRGDEVDWIVRRARFYTR